MPGEAAATVVNKAHVPDWSARVYGKQKFAGAGKSTSGLLVPLERRLARVDVRAVLERLREPGYFLQLAPELPVEEEISRRFAGPVKD